MNARPADEPDESSLTAIALVRAMHSRDWEAARALVRGTEPRALALDCAALASWLTDRAGGDEVLAALLDMEVHRVHGVPPS